jgi:hypothetical protein
MCKKANRTPKQKKGGEKKRGEARKRVNLLTKSCLSWSRKCFWSLSLVQIHQEDELTLSPVPGGWREGRLEQHKRSRDPRHLLENKSVAFEGNVEEESGCQGSLQVRDETPCVHTKLSRVVHQGKRRG